MDEMDAVQAREQRDRDLALANMRARIDAAFAPREGGIDGQCIDCAQPIEPERMAALRGCCSRCIQCASEHELRMRGSR